MSHKRPWVELWDFFSQLPSHSKTKAKIAADPEVARIQVSALSEEQVSQMLDEQANPDHSGDSLTTEGYDQYVAKLNEVIDGINLLRFSVLVSMGSKDKSFTPVPRPTTEFNKLLKKRMYEVDERQTKEAMAEFGF